MVLQRLGNMILHFIIPGCSCHTSPSVNATGCQPNRVMTCPFAVAVIHAEADIPGAAFFFWCDNAFFSSSALFIS